MIHCSAHRIIDDLKACRKFAGNEAVYKAVTLDLDRSQKFCFDYEFSPELTEFGFAAFNEGFLLPPYELCYFEFISTQCHVHFRSPDKLSHWALLIKKLPEGVLIDAFERCDSMDEDTGTISVRATWFPVATLRVFPVKGSDEPEVFGLPSSWASIKHRGSEEGLNRFRDFLQRAAFGYMASLESKSVSAETRTVSRKLNRDRIAKGKAPIFEYRSVSLILPSTQAVKLDGQGGTHASPRMHWRRGHIRTLSNKGRVPVSPCLVGAAENGLLMKEYRASLGRHQLTAGYDAGAQSLSHEKEVQ